MSTSTDAAARDHDVLGPIDLLVVQIPPEGLGPDGFGVLLDLAERGVIRILDLEVLSKAEDSSVAPVKLASDVLPELSALAPFIGSFSGLMNEDDIREAGSLIEAGHLGVVVIYENEWVVSLAAVLHGEGARLVASGRIPDDEFEAALGEGSG